MKVKTRICKIKDMDGQPCGAAFTPRSSTQVACSWVCALHKNAQDKVRLAEKEAAAQRAEHRAAKIKAKTLRQWLAECQEWCNKFIRLRDAHLPCITCGTTSDVQYAAGHYRTRGAAGHLRFNEDNINKQCNKRCNLELGGNIRAYVPALIAKIGQERFDALENDNSSHKWSIPEVQEKIKYFKAKIKELENGNA